MTKSKIIFWKNSTRLSYFERTYTFTVNWLLSNRIRLDTQPPYQRGLVWNKPMNISLIESLCSGIRISPLSFIRKGIENGDYEKYWVADGRQRIESSIWGFFDDNYSINIELDDGRVKALTYTQIEKLSLSDSACKEFLNTLLSATIDINVFRNMPMDIQRILFKKINQSKSLSNSEKIFTDTYAVKSLCQHILYKELNPIFSFMPKKIQKDVSMDGIRMVFEMIYHQFGDDFQGEFSIRNASHKKQKESAFRLQNRLNQNYGINDNTQVDLELISKFDFYDSIKCIQDSALYLSMCLTQHPANKKLVLSKVDILDLMLFFISMTRDGIFTYTFCEKNSKTMMLLIKKYLIWKCKTKNTKQHSDGKLQITNRYTKLVKFFFASRLDLEKKNKKATQIDKQKAILLSNGMCPISGRSINVESVNIEYDHNVSTKLSSLSDVTAVVNTANRVKTIV